MENTFIKKEKNRKKYINTNKEIGLSDTDKNKEFIIHHHKWSALECTNSHIFFLLLTRTIVVYSIKIKRQSSLSLIAPNNGNMRHNK